MANTFLTPQEIAMESMAQLTNNTVMAQLVHRDFENEFASKGDTIQIRKPATLVAKDFTGTTEPQDITEGSVPVKLDKIADITLEVTSKQLSLDIKNFSKQVIEPAMIELADKIDREICNVYKDIPYIAGFEGQTPNDLTALANAGKVLNINKAPTANRSLVVDPEAHASLITIPAIVNAEKSGTTEALRNASLGRVLGFNIYMDQNIPMHYAGTYADSATNVTITGDIGSQFVKLESTDGFGYLDKGDILVVNYDRGPKETSYYVVDEFTGDAQSGVLANVKLKEPLKDKCFGHQVKIVKSHVANLAFNKNAIALVNRPMALPLGGANGYVANYGGLSIRVTMGYTMTNKVNEISFDILYGVKVLEPKLAVRLLG